MGVIRIPKPTFPNDPLDNVMRPLGAFISESIVKLFAKQVFTSRSSTLKIFRAVLFVLRFDQL